jgi:cation transport ATPase
MHSRSIKLGRRHELWIYLALLFVYVTGIAWMVLHYGINRGDGLEDTWHVVETWMLRAHGAAAMGTLIAFGSMLPAHVPTAWTLRRNVVTGIGMLSTIAILAATGWLLYYAPGESARAWSSYLHMAAGVAGPMALLWHLAYRKKRSRNTRQTDRQRLAPVPRIAKNVLLWRGSGNQRSHEK